MSLLSGGGHLAPTPPGSDPNMPGFGNFPQGEPGAGGQVGNLTFTNPHTGQEKSMWDYLDESTRPGGDYGGPSAREEFDELMANMSMDTMKYGEEASGMPGLYDDQHGEAMAESMGELASDEQYQFTKEVEDPETGEVRYELADDVLEAGREIRDQFQTGDIEEFENFGDETGQIFDEMTASWQDAASGEEDSPSEFARQSLSPSSSGGSGSGYSSFMSGMQSGNLGADPDIDRNTMVNVDGGMFGLPAGYSLAFRGFGVNDKSYGEVLDEGWEGAMITGDREVTQGGGEGAPGIGAQGWGSDLSQMGMGHTLYSNSPPDSGNNVIGWSWQSGPGSTRRWEEGDSDDDYDDVERGGVGMASEWDGGIPDPGPPMPPPVFPLPPDLIPEEPWEPEPPGDYIPSNPPTGDLYPPDHDYYDYPTEGGNGGGYYDPIDKIDGMPYDPDQDYDPDDWYDEGDEGDEGDNTGRFVQGGGEVAMMYNPVWGQDVWGAAKLRTGQEVEDPYTGQVYHEDEQPDIAHKFSPGGSLLQNLIGTWRTGGPGGPVDAAYGASHGDVGGWGQATPVASSAYDHTPEVGYQFYAGSMNQHHNPWETARMSGHDPYG